MKNVGWLRSLRWIVLVAVLVDLAFLIWRVVNGDFTGNYPNQIEHFAALVFLLAVFSGLLKLSWGEIALLVIVVPFLHYTLPQHDIVRVTNTYNRNTDIGTISKYFFASADSGTTSSAVRDIRFIETVFPDESTVMVYRNEDTGWIWPPYFKYDSSNLQAEAGNLKSTKDAPVWVSLTHYGWRWPLESIYPNAVSIRQVAGPDVVIIPWVNIIVLLALGVLAFMARQMWLQFRERMVDPAVAGMEEAQDRARGFFGRIVDRLTGRAK